ncbi:glycosyltransferase [Candidatus Falkowbacteria bacterium]|nr:glycosyltransferase [Candidatus Falkowbacteria bacterium]
MKLLILTQIVDLNNDLLGFMHGWIAEFAGNCELVTVICLKKGEVDLPNNVKVLSLGKETGKSKIKYIFNFYRYIWQYRGDYDKVFVHMNYEYVNLGGIFWRLLGKKIGLWYAHGYAPLGLKTAEKLTDIIITSTGSGCRLNSDKIKVVGQGIDIEKFAVKNYETRLKNRNKIISVGRISPSKDYNTLIKAVEILKNKGIKLSVEIIGGPAVKADENYFSDLKRKITDKKLTEEIKFIGPVANRGILKFLQDSALFVNMGQTGSLDKVMAEAMSAELPIITCNEAMLEVLGKHKEALMYPKKDFEKLADRIEYIINLPLEEYRELGRNLRNIIIEKHSLKNFIDKVLNLYLKI